MPKVKPKRMKIKTRIYLTFAVVAFVPAFLIGITFKLLGTDENMSADTARGLFASVILILFFTALLVTFWNKHGILDPITKLSKGLNQVREGNFEYAVEAEDASADIVELISDYENMRVRLRENELKSIEQENKNRELVSNISHDLKTPITSIKGYVEGILDGVASTPEKQQKYLKTIYDKAVEMDKLINELTAFSNACSDNVIYNFLKLKVKDYFNDCAEEVGLDMDNRGIGFEYKNSLPDDTVIIADPEQLRKVINNIIGNSVKYMDKDEKKISIRVLDGGDDVVVEMEDNGKGISASDMPRIFDRFYRADSARTTARGGSGIGLSIVKKIIEDHGGRIWATSVEGKGTCMHFIIRKHKEDIYGQDSYY